MSVSSTPKDAQVMAAILRDMGVSEYEPRVIGQLLEFAYRYVSDVLDDARIVSEHAAKRTIDVEDIKLAVESKLDLSFTQPPPRELLLELATEKNSVQLAPIKQQYGLRLPPDRFCLLQSNYRLKSNQSESVGQRSGTTGLGYGRPPPPYNAQPINQSSNVPPTTTGAPYSVPAPSQSVASSRQTSSNHSSPAPVVQPQQSSQMPGGPVFRLVPAQDTNRKRKADEAKLDEDYDI